jgi:hypothetical protein
MKGVRSLAGATWRPPLAADARSDYAKMRAAKATPPLSFSRSYFSR